jgi:sulfofructose kinase
MGTLLPVGARVDQTIFGLGLCVVDEAYCVSGAPADERTRYRERVVGPGGMVANALLQVAALGGRAELISLVGDDAAGRWLLRTLRQRGVGTRRVLRSPDFATTRALILVDAATGERRFVLPERASRERRVPAFSLSALRANSVLMVDGHFPHQAQVALETARARGAITMADFARLDPAFEGMWPSVDYPVVPRSFVDSANLGSPREVLRWLRERSGGTPVVTLGSDGALALVEGRFRRIRPHRVAVRDTTGAGDAFHGALASGLSRGLPILAALDLASRAGAFACRALGATSSLLSPRDVNTA